MAKKWIKVKIPKALTQKERDSAMAAIMDYYRKQPDGIPTPRIFEMVRTLRKTDLYHLVDYLCACDYIVLTESETQIEGSFAITPTGKKYFEEKREEKDKFAHDWKIALFPALLGAALSEPLWRLIKAIAALFPFP